MSLDIGKSFKFPFADPNWIAKIVIGTVLSWIPIVNFFSIGNAYRVFKKVLNKEEPALLEWDDWGGFFMDGLKVFVIYLIYMIVPIIIMFAAQGLIASAMYKIAMGGSGGAGMVIGWLIYIIGIILGICLGIIMPMAVAYFAKNNEDFGAVFRFKEIIADVFKVFGDYILVIVIAVGVSIAFAVTFMIIIGFVLVPISIFYLMVVFASLYGQAFAPAFDGASAPPAKKA
jgi:hypothetical protein